MTSDNDLDLLADYAADLLDEAEAAELERRLALDAELAALLGHASPAPSSG